MGETQAREAMRQAILRAARKAGRGRWQRLVCRPVTTLRPYIMRRLNIQRPVDVKTVWGGTFSGMLGESVSNAIWSNGSFETDVSLSLLSYLPPGGIFVDVGAHFGYFSLLASKLAGEQGAVISIEAMPSTFKHLTSNVERNATHKNVQLLQCAAYSHETELEFRDFGLAASSLNSAFGPRDNDGMISSAGLPVKVRARAVDDILVDLAVKRVDLIKIDAESSEKFVLQGLRRTIEKFHPAIIMELGDAEPSGTATAEHLATLGAHGYVPYVWNENGVSEEFRPQGWVKYANPTFRNLGAGS